MRKFSGLLIAFASALLAVGAAHADEDRLYVAPMFSYSYADGDRLTKDGLGAQLAIGGKLTSGLALELTGFFSRYDGENQNLTAEFKGIGLGANLFIFGDRPDLYTRLALHYGETSDAPCEPRPGFASCRSNYSSTVFDIGLGYLARPGILRFLGDGAAIRLEALYRMDSFDDRNVGRGGDKAHYDGVFNIGLQIPLGRYVTEVEEEEDVRVIEAQRPVCPDFPNLPPDVPTDADGCPLDEDGDGVPDYLDRCPGTPPGVAVDSVGCPLPLSQCRPPFPGEAVDERGCATGDTIVLRGVTFEFNSERVSANARVILDGVADTLLTVPDLEVEIGGHTDSIGAASYNQALSQRRADSVKDYLVGRGVSARQLSTRGYGEERPIESNETEDGRELNRRVELKILNTGN
jgi:OOP family OmpA-OmpF porin